MGRVENLENDAKEKRPKGRLILKTLRRCRSLGSLRKGDQKRQMLPPEGCFSVYVGPGRERFMVRTECLNHSLFRALLDEAEMVFGYPASGPLELPCDVGLFRQVVVQVEQDAAELHSPRCSFSKGPPRGYLLMSPAWPLIMGPRLFVNMGSKSAEEMLEKNNGVCSLRFYANNTKPATSQLAATSARDNDYKEPFIIGVAGGAASGKNSVSDMIIEQLRDQRVVLVHQESFYFDLTEEELKHVHEYNFDHPDAFDFENLLSCMEKLKRGMAVDVPNYDFITHHRKLPARKVNPSDVIVLEGILMFHDPHVREMMNMKIFVDTDADMRLARRIKRDTIEKGRDIKAVLDQYSKFVKPAFDDFILPTKKYADVIIPRGGDNQVGVDLIVQHIRTKLGQHNLCKIYPNLYVIHSTFQIRGMHTLIRDAETKKHDFIFYSDRLIRLVVEQGLAHLPFHEKQVITPTGSVYTGVEYCKKLCGISVIRSGESMENALRECCKGIKIGRILIHKERDSQQLIYYNLPKDIADRHVLLLDPMLATGNSAVQAITLLLEKGIQESNIIFLNLISAPQGLLLVCKKFPRIKIVTSAIDYGLNEDFQVVPGMGQFGDRYFGTEDD